MFYDVRDISNIRLQNFQHVRNGDDMLKRIEMLFDFIFTNTFIYDLFGGLWGSFTVKIFI